MLPHDFSGARRDALPRTSISWRASRTCSSSAPGSTLDTERRSDLQKLTMTLNLAGEYTNIRRFIHQLETAPEFLVLESVAVAQEEEGERALNVTRTSRRTIGQGAMETETTAASPSRRPRTSLLVLLGSSSWLAQSCGPGDSASPAAPTSNPRRPAQQAAGGRAARSGAAGRPARSARRTSRRRRAMRSGIRSGSSRSRRRRRRRVQPPGDKPPVTGPPVDRRAAARRHRRRSR